MKKIWLISYSFDGVMSGPSIRFQRYAPLFQERGYRLQFITFYINKKLPDYEEREQFDIHRVKVDIRTFARTRFISKALLLILRKEGFGSNVLTFSMQTYQLWLIPVLKYFFRFKLFYINTMAAETHFRHGITFFDRLWNRIHLGLYKWLYQMIDGVVCSTAALAEQMRPMGLKESKAFIINNGVDMTRFRPLPKDEKLALRYEMGLPIDALLFLFVGLKTERKGIRELFEAWGQLENKGTARLLLVGDEKEEANTKDFNKWWAESKINARSENIDVFEGTRDIVPWFQAVDVFVFPSKKEGMPNVLLEAMACGLPVIMNQFEGYSEDYGIAGRTHLLFKHQPSHQSFKESLNMCLINNEKRVSLGENASSHARHSFSVESSITSYMDLFNS